MLLQLTHLKEVESTNNYAMGAIKAGLAQHGMAWHADMQTKGRGQHGKLWVSRPGENISLSLIVDTITLPLANQFTISMIAALAAHQLFSAHAGDETTIKWPNDIYWRDRKAAGILIENHLVGDKWLNSVIGIGMNINPAAFDPALKNPVSLKQVTGKTFNVAHLAQTLGNNILQLFEKYIPDNDGLLALYNKHLYKCNQQIRLKKDTAIFSCTLIGVNAFGELCVEGAAKECYSHAEAQIFI